MPDITIPAEAVEAARIAVAKAIIADEDGITAAIAAALSAWPGAVRNGFLMNEVGQSLPAIILPLTHEKTDETAYGSAHLSRSWP